jgi:hypothetical protein
MTRSIFVRTITRRRVLKGGVACALATFAPRGVLGALVSEAFPAAMRGGGLRTVVSPNLYAFAGAPRDTTAIAVTWQEQVDQSKMDLKPSSKICVHAGSTTWEVEVPNQALPKVQRSDDMSVFIGEVLSPSGVGEELVRAVVIELPNQVMGRSGAAGIWAEYNAASLRQRIGTPFLANFVAADQSLATIYHCSSPAEDRDRLTSPLAKSIAARLQANGFSSNSLSQGRRLASALLPDVLRYDSDCPAGFTFAAQNGRHPSELTDEVVNALLNGGASSASSVRSAYQSVESFPYFRQVTASI